MGGWGGGGVWGALVENLSEDLGEGPAHRDGDRADRGPGGLGTGRAGDRAGWGPGEKDWDRGWPGWDLDLGHGHGRSDQGGAGWTCNSAVR